MALANVRTLADGGWLVVGGGGGSEEGGCRLSPRVAGRLIYQRPPIRADNTGH